MIRAVAFDLDGTLVDSHRDIATAVNHALRALGRPPATPEAVRGMIGDGAHALLGRALATSDEALIAEGRRVFADAYLACLTDETRAYRGMLEAIRRLAGRGTTVVVATNKPALFTQPILARLGFLDAGVRAFASADEAGAKKPDPSVLALALRRAGASDALGQALAYAGDMAVDVATARAAGCRAIGVAWGYDPVALRAAHPDGWVDDPLELDEALGS